MLPIFHKRSYENGALKVRFQETGIPSAHRRPQGQGWAMDNEGYSYVTFTRPTSPHFYQGIAIKNGAMYVSTTLSSDDYRVGGLRIGRDGALKVSAASTASEGLLIASDGTLAVSGLSFFAPLADAGSGVVSTTILGTGSATFTRATTATTVNSAGLIVSVASGTPRSWYWPDTLVYGGYLAEGARTNLTINSVLDGGGAAPTSFTQPIGTGTSAPVASTKSTIGVAYAQTASATRPFLSQSITLAATTTYSQSMVIESVSGLTNSQILGNPSGLTVTYYANGVAVAGGDTAVTGTLSGVFTTAGGGATDLRWGIGILAAATGSLTFSCLQVEAGTFASSYIPTTTASVTRNADVLTYTFSGNADATQGTAYAELGTEWSAATGSAQRCVTFGAGGDNPLEVSSAAAATTIRISDGVNNAAKTGLTNMSTASRKRASSWGTNLVVTGDGATVATGTFDGGMGSTAIGIGALTDGTQAWFGPIKNVAIYEQQFTNTQIQEMTA